MWFSEFIIQRFIWISNLQHYFELDDRDFLGKKPTKKQIIMIIALARIIHNPSRKRGTSNKIPRLRIGLRKTACKKTSACKLGGKKVDKP